MTQFELSEFLDAPFALFHSEAEKDKMEGQVICYSDKKYLSGISTLNNIIAVNDKRLMAILEDALSKQQDIPFMAIEMKGQLKG